MQLEDEVSFTSFLQKLSNEALFQRFNHQLCWNQINLLKAFYEVLNSELCLIATLITNNNKEIIGVVDFNKTRCDEIAEYAIIVLDEWHHHGIGSLLTEIGLTEIKNRGVGKVYAITTYSNIGMRKLFDKFNFTSKTNIQENEVYVEKSL